jgi:hypothetical protein
MGWFIKQPWVNVTPTNPVVASPLATGFEVVGGTTQKKLIVDVDATVSELGGVDDPLMVEIPEYDPALIGKKYQGEKFVDSGIVPPPPPVDPMAIILLKLEKLEKDIALIMDKMA